jgi:polyisoprenoid-binding protein YceI
MNLYRLRVLALISLLLIFINARVCRADSWKLPAPLDDSNTSITFVVDSTWHTVHGSTKGVKGHVELENPKDPLSVRAELSIPVSFFNTDGESRDDRLREVMASALFPTVSFTSSRLSESCAPQKVAAASRCEGTLRGILKIRDVQKEIGLPVTITTDKDHFIVQGELPIRWADFHVEDPSILIAKLDPTVTITYRTLLPIYR